MLKLLNNEKLIVGYDLSDDYSQISYCAADSGNENVETLSLVAGSEDFKIPTVLCKREGASQWFYGREALRYAEENEGILIRNLLSLAVDGEPVQIDGESFDPVALLALFFKRSLGLLAQVSSPDRISALMITSKELDHRLMEVLNQAVAGLRLKTDKVFFQSHTESFYYYMIHQTEELWRFRTVLMEYGRKKIKTYSMECNRRTNPVVAYIEEKDYPFEGEENGAAGDRLPVELVRMDRDYLDICQELFGDSQVSGVYLIGEQFSEEWMKESLRYLCKGRRVFQGNNLYSKGACYGMMERLLPSEVGKNHVFLGKDKLKANIGMKILRQGEESYYALLDAGVNWFEAEQTFEFYLREGNRVELMITSLIGRSNKLAQIILEDLDGALSRLRAHLYLSEENRLVVEIEDLGLGVFRPATHHVWKEEIVL